jgi:hypothetical protein
MPASHTTIGQKRSCCLGRRVALTEGLRRAGVLISLDTKLGKYPDFTFEWFQGI